MLTLENLGIRVGNKQVCSALNLTVGKGERWAVLGINGIGKTTLLHTLAGLRVPDTGKVSLAETGRPPGRTCHEDGTGRPSDRDGPEEVKALSELPPRLRARQIGLMSQDDDFSAESRVLDAVLLGRLPHLHWWRGETPEDKRIAHEALAQVGLDASFADRLASTLSGGERRRVALAALLAQSAPLLILDEPTTHLDLHQQIALLDLLVGLRSHTLVMSLHDVNLAARYCTHALLLFGEGQCCSGSIAEMLSNKVLSTLYHHEIRSTDTPTGAFYFPA